MKIIGYTVIRGTHYSTFVDSVKFQIKDGVQPFGSISTTTVYEDEQGNPDPNGRPVVHYAQAMVKYQE
jgi:hypothetical protein